MPRSSRLSCWLLIAFLPLASFAAAPAADKPMQQRIDDFQTYNAEDPFAAGAAVGRGQAQSRHAGARTARAEAGEEIAVTRRAKPMAKIVAIEPASGKRQFGAYRGKIAVGPEFFDPLPDDELNGWE